MTKTPEELTEEWKARKLVQGWYFCKLKNGLIHHFEFNGNDFTDLTCHIPPVAKILAPCNYDEHKAMQAAIQNGESAIDTNKRLCKKIEELKEQLAEHRENCCCFENEKLRLDKAKLEEKIEDLEDRIAELEKENKQLEEDSGYGWHTAGIESDKNDELRGLLKECLAHLSLGEIGTSVTPVNILIDRINAALGESEE